MKRTIEIDDTLNERTDSAIEDVEQYFMAWLDMNEDARECPDLWNHLDRSGAIHEIIDGSVPIYTAEIDAIFYLHGYWVESAFDDAGIGDKNDDAWPCG